jgi:hypothetical protein
MSPRHDLSHLTPEQRRERKRMQDRAAEARRKERNRELIEISSLRGRIFSQEPPSPAAIAERDRMLRQPVTPNMLLLGDPPLGRRWLDRMAP